jgi:hypothetical protein
VAVDRVRVGVEIAHGRRDRAEAMTPVDDQPRAALVDASAARAMGHTAPDRGSTCGSTTTRVAGVIAAASRASASSGSASAVLGRRRA